MVNLFHVGQKATQTELALFSSYVPIPHLFVHGARLDSVDEEIRLIVLGRDVRLPEPAPALWNQNRNRRGNLNFLTSGTGTVTCSKVGIGTVINYSSGTGTRYKIKYLTFFSFTFYNKFVEIYKLFKSRNRNYNFLKVGTGTTTF